VKHIIFLCTGNYYRSRFAEILFNHHARALSLDWKAGSRGLGTHLNPPNWGPLSPYTVEAVGSRGIACPSLTRAPAACLRADLESADRVIAVKDAEHRPMMQQQFSDFADRIEYWHVHDLDGATPAEALVQIERHVLDLIRSPGL